MPAQAGMPFPAHAACLQAGNPRPRSPGFRLKAGMTSPGHSRRPNAGRDPGTHPVVTTKIACSAPLFSLSRARGNPRPRSPGFRLKAGMTSPGRSHRPGAGRDPGEPCCRGPRSRGEAPGKDFLDSGESRSDGRGGPSDSFVVTLSYSEGSKVLDCIPLFNTWTGFLLKDIDSSPPAQNDIFPENGERPCEFGGRSDGIGGRNNPSTGRSRRTVPQPSSRLSYRGMVQEAQERLGNV